MTRLVYREATYGDADRVAELHADSWRRTYRGMYADAYLDGDLLGERRAVWTERLQRPKANQFVLLALASDRLAGFVCGYGGEDPVWGSFVDNLHVASDARRLGIGAELMRRTGAWFATSDPDRGVYLWVLEANTGARRFYEAIGASNAETVEMEVHTGHRAMSCRYIWPDARALAG